jgi:hypothetical protein
LSLIAWRKLRLRYLTLKLRALCWVLRRLRKAALLLCCALSLGSVFALYPPQMGYFVKIFYMILIVSRASSSGVMQNGVR